VAVVRGTGLRVKDVDSLRAEPVVRDGKGQKERAGAAVGSRGGAVRAGGGGPAAVGAASRGADESGDEEGVPARPAPRRPGRAHPARPVRPGRRPQPTRAWIGCRHRSVSGRAAGGWRESKSLVRRGYGPRRLAGIACEGRNIAPSVVAT